MSTDTPTIAANTTTTTTSSNATRTSPSIILGPGDFDSCWLEPISGGMYWMILVGSILIIYCYASSKKLGLWNVLFVHAITGIGGVLMETAWTASALCNIMKPSLAWLLLVNEFNFILNESAVVYYSYIKTSTVITNKRVESLLKYMFVGFFVAFAALRLNIGRTRFQLNQLNGNDAIGLAHSYAFIVWGLADLVLMVLLVMNVMDYLKRQASANTGKLVVTLLNSSLPRFFIIFLNTLIICALQFVINGNANPSQRILNFNQISWLIKGTYPILLLLDILMTHFLMYKEAKSTNNGSSSKELHGDTATATTTLPTTHLNSPLGQGKHGHNHHLAGVAVVGHGNSMMYTGNSNSNSNSSSSSSSNGQQPAAVLTVYGKQNQNYY